jgi:hypothetical protein
MWLPGDFLSILSEIERNYLYVTMSCARYLTSVDDPHLRLDDDRDASSNGDGMTTLMNNN